MHVLVMYTNLNKRDIHVILAVKAVEPSWVDIRDSNIAKLNILGVRLFLE